MGAHEVYAILGHGDHEPVRVPPGGLIGRLRSADLRIDDPRVSEAHAYVSLRDGALKLLALRGGLAVGGRLVRDVTLTRGLEITLAKGDPPLILRSVEVQHPATMLAVQCPGMKTEVLGGGRCLSLMMGSAPPTLTEGFRPEAPAIFWTDGEGWVVRVAGSSPLLLEAGTEFTVNGCTFAVVEVTLRVAHTPDTDLDANLANPVRIEGFFDTVHMHRAGHPPLVLSGAPARLIYELGTIGQPVWWRDVANTLWPDDVEENKLRKRWDVLMVRLRKRLTEASIRPSLVQADGGGKVRLLLERADTFHDCG